LPPNPTAPESNQAAAATPRKSTPHDRKAVYELVMVLATLVLTIVLSILSGQDLYILGYIVVIVYALLGPTRRHRPWQELGLKHGFLNDFRRVWYYFGIDALLFQLLPPILGIAFVFGYYSQLLKEITGRLSINFGSLAAVSAIASLLAASLILTLLEEVVFRVTIQERLSWFIGTPGAILFTSLMFGAAHSVGASGSPLVVITDVAGVALDGAFFGIIYAKTHNLALTWATHYIADVVGLIALLLIY
jgi:membrane protease YdiL (CAAX protease family)